MSFDKFTSRLIHRGRLSYPWRYLEWRRMCGDLETGLFPLKAQIFLKFYNVLQLCPESTALLGRTFLYLSLLWKHISYGGSSFCFPLNQHVSSNSLIWQQILLEFLFSPLKSCTQTWLRDALLCPHLCR